MRRYEATFTVTVDLTINDDNVIERVLNNEDGWRDDLYDLDEGETVEMLARCCGIWQQDLSSLDGWADMPDSALRATAEIDFDSYRRVA